MTKVLDPAQTGRDALKLEAGLRQRIVGQEEAIQQVVQAYQTNLSGMSSPGRPVCNLLFLGPTGSGKTRLVEAVAESLVGDARAVVKVDCAEFQHSHEISKLIGSPPGYLGHRETHAALSQDALNAHHTDTIKLSFVLFDEIEKASDALWNLLLGILDKATLTLGDNRKVDFSRAMIFMTSNLGAAEMETMVRPRLGFAAGELMRRCDPGVVGNRLTERISRIGLEAARRKFTPEFMNRIDRTVVFRSLGTEELRGILSIELKAVQDRILSNACSSAFVLTVTESARDFLLREGTDLKYGARHLKRAIDRYLVHPLSNLIATEQVSGGDILRIDFDDAQAQLTFLKDVSWRPASVIARLANSSGTPATGPARTGAATEPMRWLRARNKP
ncbi:MAG TPA: AAA family ATPase [Candidatus Acidoferrum sp.]|nr:AAA family ATPase [Candidatus Acidoferrum sp.]